ncbi:MAG TPA: DUF3160 domain-containing protein [Polyangiaceae bacterium]|nr:DUF3160 domain-containing protein [Polyangiaceae bacterium]
MIFVGACAAGSGGALRPAPSVTPIATVVSHESCEEARAAAACAELRTLRGVEPHNRGGAADAADRVFAGPPVPAQGNADACAVTEEPLRALVDAIAAEPARGPGATDPPPTAAWPPRYLDRVDARLSLSVAERSALQSNGFVVADRLRVSSYGEALDELSEWQLPIFVSADMLLSAVHAGHEALVITLEQEKLAPAMRELLAAIACDLPAASRAWPAEVAHDVELFVSVARALFRADPTRVDEGEESGDAGDDSTCRADGGDGGIGAETRALVRALTGDAAPPVPAQSSSVVLERAGALDPSLFRPHGHYAVRALGLAGYFRAATWLSRLELRLGEERWCGGAAAEDESRRVGPSLDEALDALALAELVERSGAAPELETIDRAWSLFAARRHDLSMKDLIRLRASAEIHSLSDPLAASKLQAVLDGADLAASREGVSEACGPSSIATMLAPRIASPGAATSHLVGDAVPERTMIHAADIAYALGNDRAKTYLAGDLARWPELAAGLDRAREQAAIAPSGEGLDGAWLDAIRGLAEGPSASAPSFMRTNAWRDLRLNTTVAALGQIHDDALPATASTARARGSPIRDVWLEPIPATIDAALSYAVRGSRGMAEIDPHDTTRLGAYFDRLARLMGVLRRILDHELSGDPPGEDERRFLGMIARYDRSPPPGCTGAGCAPVTCPGWWFDLSVDPGDGGMVDPQFVADYFVSAERGEVAYVGVGAPRLGIFVVDSNGPARAMVGAVTTAYEAVGPLQGFVGDRDSTHAGAGSSPWSASYTVPATTVPATPAPQGPTAP